jgi:hypothetical protein
LHILALMPEPGNVARATCLAFVDSRMKDALLALLHVVVVAATLCRRGGVGHHPGESRLSTSN